MLPQTSKAILKYKSDGTDSGAKGMIALLMGTATDHSVTSKITLEEGYSKGSNKGSGDNDKYFNKTVMGIMGLGDVSNFNIIPGTISGYNVTGNTISIMQDSSTLIQKQLLSTVGTS
jgi:hypothetical protein